MKEIDQGEEPRDWGTLHIMLSEETEDEYDPTEEELLDELAQIIVAIYLKQKGIKDSLDKGDQRPFEKE